MARRLVRARLRVDMCRRAVLAKSQCCCSRAARAFAWASRSKDACSSSWLMSIPSRRMTAAAVVGVIPVVICSGDRPPRDMRGMRLIAPCTSLMMRGHLFTGTSRSRHSVVRMSLAVLLARTATPYAQLAYGVHLVCGHPLILARAFTTALSKWDPPSVCSSSGSG